jgi:hypothetical protein
MTLEEIRKLIPILMTVDGGFVKLGNLEFSSSDFDAYCDGNSHSETMAEIANEILKEKLEKAQQVQLRFVGKTVHVICVHEPLYTANTDAYGTARLVCIENISLDPTA